MLWPFWFPWIQFLKPNLGSRKNRYLVERVMSISDQEMSSVFCPNVPFLAKPPSRQGSTRAVSPLAILYSACTWHQRDIARHTILRTFQTYGCDLNNSHQRLIRLYFFCSRERHRRRPEAVRAGALSPLDEGAGGRQRKLKFRRERRWSEAEGQGRRRWESGGRVRGRGHHFRARQRPLPEATAEKDALRKPKKNKIKDKVIGKKTRTCWIWSRKH